MSSENAYSVYAYLENMKNSLYRTVSGARVKGLFWPTYYYSFFYSNEKVMYNCLVNRQKLPVYIQEQEVNEYNEIRNSILPKTSYYIVLKKCKTHEGVNFNEATLSRKDYYLKQCLALGLFAHCYLQLTRFWLVGAFIPALGLRYIDYKFMPYDEINNFYKYLLERKEANELFSVNQTKVSEKIKKDSLSAISSELEKTNKSLEQAIFDLHSAYLNAALDIKV